MTTRLRKLVLAALLMGPVAHGKGPPTFLLENDGDGLHPWATVDAGRYTLLHAASDVPEPVQVRYRLPGQNEDRVRNIEGMLLYPLDRHDRDAAGRVAGWRMANESIIDDAGGILADPPIGRDGVRLYSTVRPVFHGQTLPAGPRDLRAARALLRPLLSRHRVPHSAWRAILDSSVVMPLTVGVGAPPVMVITGTAPVPERRRAPLYGEKVFSYLIVAEQGRTGYRNVATRVHYGGQVCGVTSWDLLGQADLDVDGRDELLIAVWGWETGNLAILRRAGGRWQSALQPDHSEPSC